MKITRKLPQLYLILLSLTIYVSAGASLYIEDNVYSNNWSITGHHFTGDVYADNITGWPASETGTTCVQGYSGGDWVSSDMASTLISEVNIQDKYFTDSYTCSSGTCNLPVFNTSTNNATINSLITNYFPTCTGTEKLSFLTGTLSCQSDVDTNTQYTSGWGLTLATTVFSVDNTALANNTYVDSTYPRKSTVEGNITDLWTNATNQNTQIVSLITNSSGQETHINNLFQNASNQDTQITNLWSNASLQSGQQKLLWDNASNQDTRIINIEGLYVHSDTWTSINNYPSGCSAGNYVTGLGDTLSCSAAVGSVSAGTGLLVTGTTDLTVAIDPSVVLNNTKAATTYLKLDGTNNMSANAALHWGTSGGCVRDNGTYMLFERPCGS
jgi:hypothetical protein